MKGREEKNRGNGGGKSKEEKETHRRLKRGWEYHPNKSDNKKVFLYFERKEGEGKGKRNGGEVRGGVWRGGKGGIGRGMGVQRLKKE